MRSEIEPGRARPPIIRRAVAGVVILVAAALAIHVIIGVVLTLVWIVAVIAVIGAVLWAVKTLVW